MVDIEIRLGFLSIKGTLSVLTNHRAVSRHISGVGPLTGPVRVHSVHSTHVPSKGKRL